MTLGASERPRGTGTAIGLLWLAAAGIVAYWVSFFGGGEVHAAEDPCYLAFERNFPLPDGFVALCALVAVYAGYPKASVGVEIVRDELDRLEAERTG